MHNLVMRQRQHVIFRECIEHPERELIVVIAAMNRVVGEILERVMHPAHVPLVAKTEAAQVSRLRHARPCGRFLGDREGIGIFAVNTLIESAKKIKRFEILPATEAVRGPFAFLARVVVDVILVEPKESVADEEVANFLTAEVEDEGAPVLMLSLLGVGVLEEMGAVEIAEAVLVPREMGGNPIENDADAALMQRVDEGHEILGRAEAAGGGEVADGLISPRAVERMLGDRQ